jgi:hypothetical protein
MLCVCEVQTENPPCVKKGRSKRRSVGCEEELMTTAIMLSPDCDRKVEPD